MYYTCTALFILLAYSEINGDDDGGDDEDDDDDLRGLFKRCSDVTVTE